MCLTVKKNSEQKIGNPVLVGVAAEWLDSGRKDSHSWEQKPSQIPGVKGHRVTRGGEMLFGGREGAEIPTYDQELARPVVNERGQL